MSSGTDDRDFFSASVNLRGVVDVVLVFTLIATWIGWLGHWSWFFALFDHFRLQYLVLSVMASLWFAWCKRPRLAVFGFVCLVSNAIPIVQVARLAHGVPAGHGPELKVICFNVLSSNERRDEAIAWLSRSDADVIALLEVNRAWATAAKSLSTIYPHQLVQPSEDNFGIALFSKHPLENLRPRTFGNEEVLSITATIKVLEKPVLIVVTHPLPPMGLQQQVQMFSQFKGLRTYVQRSGLPALVCGDLNATPWSPAMQVLRQDGVLDFRSPNYAWRPTWSLGSPLFLPLDHTLSTVELVVSSREIGPDLGSDHRPQILRVRAVR